MYVCMYDVFFTLQHQLSFCLTSAETGFAECIRPNALQSFVN